LPNGFEAASATVTQGSVVLSGDTMTAVLDGLTNGEAATITLVAVPRQPGSFVNTIRAKSADCETKLQNNEVLQRLRVSLPASDLALSGSPTLPLLAKGALVAYEYRVENKGPQAAHALNFQDTLPAGLLLISAEGTKGTVAANGNSVHCQLVSLAAGASFSIKVVAQVAAAGSLTNVASIAAASSDPDPGNNTVTQSITGAAPSEVADLSVNIRGPGTTTSGAVFRLIINVGNGGPTFANGVTVTNDLGSQLEVLGTSVPPTSANNGAMVFLLGNLPPGFSTNIQVSARASSASGPTNLTAKAEVASYQADPEAGNNTAVSVVSIVPGPAEQPDLKVVILPAATAPHYCAPTVYSVGISNQSATAASGAMVTNWLPVQARYISAAASAGTVLHSPGMVILDLGVLPGHSSALLSVLIQPPGSGVLITRASIGAMDVDSNLADNVAFGATSVETPPEGAPFLIDCITLLEDGGVLLEFPTIPGRDYSIEYGTDLIPSGKALTVITATKDRTQWVDIGPPETEAKPLDVSRRFYRAVLLPQSP